MRVLFCGDREWKTPRQVKLIGSVLEQYNPEEDYIINGFARGADIIASVLAKWMGFKVIDYPADWETHRRAAGPIRNKLMLDNGIDKVEAFHNDISSSKGTANMVKIAKKAGVPININAELSEQRYI